MTILALRDGKVARFLLSRHTPSCCLGRVPQAREWIVVDADPPVAPVAEGPARVRGRLRVERSDVAGGVIEAAYHLAARRVEPAPAAPGE